MFCKKYEDNLLEKNIIDSQKIWSFVLLESKIWVDYKKMLLHSGAAYALIAIKKNRIAVYSVKDDRQKNLILLAKYDLNELTDIITKKHFYEYALSFKTKDSQIHCVFKSKKKWKLFVNVILHGGDNDASL